MPCGASPPSPATRAHRSTATRSRTPRTRRSGHFRLLTDAAPASPTGRASVEVRASSTRSRNTTWGSSTPALSRGIDPNVYLPEYTMNSDMYTWRFPASGRFQYFCDIGDHPFTDDRNGRGADVPPAEQGGSGIALTSSGRSFRLRRATYSTSRSSGPTRRAEGEAAVGKSWLPVVAGEAAGTTGRRGPRSRAPSSRRRTRGATVSVPGSAHLRGEVRLVAPTSIRAN